MSWKKNWPLLAGAVAVLLLVYFGTATFSWLSAGQKVENSFLTAYPGAKLTEAFTPPENWTRGEEIVKRVGVMNIGETGMLVRISFDEVLNKIKDEVLTQIKKDIEDKKIPYPSRTFRDALGIAENQYVSGPVIRAGEYAVPYAASTTGYTRLVPDASNVIYADPSMRLPNNLEIWVKTLENVSLDFTRKAYVYTAFFSYQENGVEKKQMVLLKNDRSAKKYAITWDRTASKFKIDTSMIEYCYFANSNMGKKTADWKGRASGRSVSLVDPKILLLYDASVVNDLASIDPIPNQKWFFNENDGYFYYMENLKPGMSTPMQLVSVKLASSADPMEFNLAEYTLNVNMEAVQCDPAALRGAWFQGKADTGMTSDERKLFQALVKCCPTE